MSIEPHSETWRTLAAEVEKQLAQAKGQLESPGLDHETTQFERGRIAAMKQILALATPRLPVSAGDVSY